MFTSVDFPIFIQDQVDTVFWVQEKLIEYPELFYLAMKEVAVAQEGFILEENDSFSKSFFGEKFIEFDRSITSLLSLYWMIQGSEEAYQKFISRQKKEEALSFQDFHPLHQEVQFLLYHHPHLSREEVLKAMEAMIVLGDIGKSKLARERFEKKGGKMSPDHDDFLEEAFARMEKHPELSPTFARLNPEQRSLLSKGLNLIHYGHILHLEGGYSMYARLFASNLAKIDPYALRFDQFIHRCDVSGALGHVDCHSAKAYVAKTHLALNLVFESCKKLAEESTSEKTAYHFYAKKRGELLGFDTDKDEDLVLCRFGCMMRLFEKEEGTFLMQSWSQLTDQEKQDLLSFFHPKNISEEVPTPTYMPAVLVNLLNHPDFGKTKQEKIIKSLPETIPFFIKAFSLYFEKREKEELDSTIRLNFRLVAEAVKKDPFSLNKKPFSIDQEGNVFFLT